jgi:hypothetical protein
LVFMAGFLRAFRVMAVTAGDAHWSRRMENRFKEFFGPCRMVNPG